MPSKVFGPYCWNLMFYQLPRILEEFSKVNATAYADDLPVIVDGDSRKELEEKGNHVVIFIDETISERKKKAIVLKSDWVKRKTIGKRGGQRLDRKRKAAIKIDLANRPPTTEEEIILNLGNLLDISGYTSTKG